MEYKALNDVVSYWETLPGCQPCSVRLDEEFPSDIYLVNGSYAHEILLDLKNDIGQVIIEVINCCGEVVRTENKELNSGLHRLKVPPEASLHMERSK